MLYLTPFLLACTLSVFLTAVFLWATRHLRWYTRRASRRHIHNKKISRLGGVIIIVAFLATLFLDPHLLFSQTLWGVIVATVGILLIGMWDDFYELDWRTQLFFQIVLVIFLFVIGVRVEYITNPLGGMLILSVGHYLLPSFLFVVAWMLLMMNAMNWLDGVDGLSGGVTVIGALTIFFLSLFPEVHQQPVGIITMALAGAVFGFLIFNFHPARIFAGSAGSLFMGFMLGVLAIFAGTKIATALLVMAIPVMDALWVVCARLRAGKSIFQPDQRHLHFKLLALGWSQRRVALFFYTLTGGIAFIALNTRAIGKSVTILTVGLLMIFVLVYTERKVQEKKVHHGTKKP